MKELTLTKKACKDLCGI